jgi:hypothetical protein
MIMNGKLLNQGKGIKDYVTVEWSPVQKCFHLDQIQHLMENNIGAFCRGKCAHYLLIGIFETHDEASKYIEALRETPEYKKYQED